AQVGANPLDRPERQGPRLQRHSTAHRHARALPTKASPIAGGRTIASARSRPFATSPVSTELRVAQDGRGTFAGATAFTCRFSRMSPDLADCKQLPGSGSPLTGTRRHKTIRGARTRSPRAKGPTK